jgi:DASH complex subunit SPC19
MSRQSVWPSAPPPSDHLHYLEDCISATEHCVTSLTSTLDKFRPGIQDFPRLNRILVNEHVRLLPPFIRSPGGLLDTHRRAKAIIIALIILVGSPRADFQKFLVLPQTTISTHLSSTSSLLSPEITKLLKRAEQLVEAERTKLAGIEKTIDILQSASLPTSRPTPSNDDNGEGEGDIWNDKLDGIELRGLDIVQVKKIRMLRNKRERLEKERVKLGLA